MKNIKPFKRLLSMIAASMLMATPAMANADGNNENTTGFKLVQNNGCLQEVKHFHLHLIPDCNVPKKDLEEVFNLLTK